MRNYLTERIMKKEYYEGAGECPECTDKLPVNTEKEREEKKKILRQLLAKAAQGNYDEQNYREGDLLPEEEYCRYLEEDGNFSDLPGSTESILEAFARLACIMERHHWRKGIPWESGERKETVLKAIIKYGRMEIEREDKGVCRFHKSLFYLPKTSVSMCFALYPDFMDAQERPEKQAPLVTEAMEVLLRVIFQCWQLPLRNNHTDAHPICVDRFRGHVWWIGANGITYRPVFYAAVLLCTPEMMDVLAEVAKRALTPTSHGNTDESFWKEGICADGLGWGHDRQNYSNGYPTQGVISALNILLDLKDTPWALRKEEICWEWVIRFMRGIGYMEYRDWVPPMIGRTSFECDGLYKPAVLTKYIRQITIRVLNLAGDELTQEQLHLLYRTLLERSPERVGDNRVKGDTGCRYFWNNDTLVRKTEEEYVFFNMASSRCDGVECAHECADTRNFFLTDGACLICKDPREYRRAVGTWQVSCIPGVTARELKNEEIMPETNWQGYHSKHSFAGGAVRGEYAAAGFIFEKDETRKKDGSGKIYPEYCREMMGVLAYKSCFVFGRTGVCMGAGITDLKPEYGRNIRTTVNVAERLTDTLIFTSAGDKEQIAPGEERIWPQDKPVYITQNGILYGLLPQEGSGSRFLMRTAERLTKWEELNACNRKVGNESCPVLELAIDHGIAPSGERYCYFFDTGSEEPSAIIGNPPFHILENSENAQAAESADGKVIQAVCYGKGELLLSGSVYEIRLAEPAVLILEEKAGELYLTISDPLQLPERKCTLEYRRKEDAWKKAVISFPENPERGKQAVIRLEK